MKRIIIAFNTCTQRIGHSAQIFGAGFKLLVIAGLALFVWLERDGQLGYVAGPNDKHRNFEAAGISREAVMAFSARWQAIGTQTNQHDRR